jgi:serine/threonine protein kinase
MKICPSCQIQYPDDALVCGQCGSRLMLDTSATMPDPKQSLVGRVIGGNYRLEKILGQGGMGIVFRARQLSLDRAVAVKLLLAPLAMDREMLERFQREARAASNIGHPGIVQVIDMGYLPEGAPFMVMEHLEGEDLRSKLEREGAMVPGLALPLFLQLCDALQAAHDKGIVHRDLKPDNIFLVYRTGGLPMVKILDFGLSKIKSADHKLTNTGALLGTPNYMSPEQVHGSSSSIDHRTDIYTAGIILYEMLTGRIAYDGPSIQSILVSIATQDPPSPRTLRPDIPEAVEAVILRAIARQPERRYQSLRELGVDLVRVAGPLGVPLSQPGFLSATGQVPGSSPWQPALQPPAGQAQAPSSPAPATPAPLSAASRPGVPSGPKKRSGRGFLLGLGIGAAVLLVFLALVGIVLLKIGVKRARLAKKLGKTKVELKGAQGGGRDITLEIDDSSGEPDETKEATTPVPGRLVGSGSHPCFCCSDKSCALMFEKVDVLDYDIYFQRLSDDLRPNSKPRLLTPGDFTGRWPVCFPRDDGGYLVLYNEVDDESGTDASVKIHRLVLSSDGKVTSRSHYKISTLQVMDDMQPAFAAAEADGRVFLVWNEFFGTSMGTKASILGMDGKERNARIALNSEAVTMNSMIACRSDRCMVGWFSMGGSVSASEMVCVISSKGSLIEKGRVTVSSSPVNHNRKLIPLKDGVMLAWADMNMGGGVQKIARLNWDGKVVSKPASIEAFGSDILWGESTGFAAGAPDGSGFILAHPVEIEGIDRMGVFVMLLDGKGGVKASTTIAIPEKDIYQCSVFFKPDGRPVVVYGLGSDSNPDLYALFPKLKK